MSSWLSKSYDKQAKLKIKIASVIQDTPSDTTNSHRIHNTPPPPPPPPPPRVTMRNANRVAPPPPPPPPPKATVRNLNRVAPPETSIIVPPPSPPPREYTIHELNAIKYCLKKYNLTQFKENGKYVAILLESRFTNNIPIILTQLSRFLNTEWSVILYVTADIYPKYVEEVSKINTSIQVKIINYKLTDVTDYNNIMLNMSFWESLKSFKKVLVFQSDTLMYRYGIEHFFNYDYIGAPWPEDLGTNSPVGNGGFSLRNYMPMINCIKNIDEIIINNYKQYSINEERLGRQPEDIILSYGMSQLGYILPSRDIAKYFSIETVDFNNDFIGSHRLDFFNRELYMKQYLNSVIPYYTHDLKNFGEHRFGWNYVTQSINNYFINKNGVLFNTWVDCEYLFDSAIKSTTINKPWVGITHLTPVYFNKYFSICNINNLKRNNAFINDLVHCKGLFTLSLYMRHYLRDILNQLGFSHIPVCNLYHPTCIIEPFFNPNTIDDINNIVSIGCQLRKNITIFKLNTELNKIWLPGRDTTSALNLLQLECDEFNIELTQEEIQSVSIRQLDNTEYDSIIIIHIIYNPIRW